MLDIQFFINFFHFGDFYTDYMSTSTTKDNLIEVKGLSYLTSLGMNLQFTCLSRLHFLRFISQIAWLASMN